MQLAETNHAHLAHPGAGPSYGGLSLTVRLLLGGCSVTPQQDVHPSLPSSRYLTLQAETRTQTHPSYYQLLELLKGGSIKA